MSRLLLVAAAAVILVTMTGCVDPKPPTTPSPTASAAPVFASEEEALAAAEDAYAAYTELSDQIFHEGGADPERLRSVATGELLDTEVAGYRSIQAKGWHSTGTTAIRSVELQSYEPYGVLEDVVAVYLCDDVSNVDVLDQNGTSVVSPDRPDRSLFEVSFDLDPASNELLVSGREIWGDGQC